MTSACRTVLLCGLVALAAGCARPLKDRLRGQWRHANGLTLSFLQDNSFTAAQGPLQVTGSYSTPDEQHVKFEVGGFLGTFIGPNVYEAKIEGEKLKLTFAGKPEEFTRVRQ